MYSWLKRLEEVSWWTSGCSLVYKMKTRKYLLQWCKNNFLGLVLSACTQAVPFCTTRGSACVVANLSWALKSFLKCGCKVPNEWIAGKMRREKIVLTVSREGGTQNTVMKRKGLNFKIRRLLLTYIITDFHSQSTTLLLCLYPLRILIYFVFFLLCNCIYKSFVSNKYRTQSVVSQ